MYRFFLTSFLALLFCFTTPLFSQKKLGEPLKVEGLISYYGEEETAPQESDYSNVYANYEERYILYDLNLYRLAPQILDNEDVNPDPEVTKCVDWGYCFKPVKPLYWNLALSRAARFHCDDMIKNDCFAHNDCDGGDIWARITRYYTSSAMGENIAAGSHYDQVTKNFINEKGAELGTVGHREAVFDPVFNEVGLGYLLGGSYKRYTTQDFGASATPHVIPAAIHEPKTADTNTDVKFKAIYHNTIDNPQVYLILDDKCHAMNKIHSNHDWNPDHYIGEQTITPMNWYSNAYVTTKRVASNCSKYSILIKVGENSYRYPDQGSLLVGNACANEIYDAQTVTNTCNTIEQPICTQNSCTEANRGVCEVKNNQITCSCDQGYRFDNGECKDSSSINTYQSESCNYGQTANHSLFYLFFFIFMIRFYLKSQKE